MATDLGLDCPAYTDLAVALARPDIHAVIVTTPSGAHREPAVPTLPRPGSRTKSPG